MDYLFKDCTSFLYQIFLQDQKHGHDKVWEGFYNVWPADAHTPLVEKIQQLKQGEAEARTPAPFLHHPEFLTTTIPTPNP